MFTHCKYYCAKKSVIRYLISLINHWKGITISNKYLFIECQRVTVYAYRESLYRHDYHRSILSEINFFKKFFRMSEQFMKYEYKDELENILL